MTVIKGFDRNHSSSRTQEEHLAERISQQINNRDKEMMDYIRQSQRQNQQQLLEIVAAKEKEQQKSFFARLFGK